MVPFPPPLQAPPAPPALVYPWAPRPVPVALADACRVTLDLPLDGLTDAEWHDFKSCVLVALWRTR
jgi:hypothetical protein